MMMSAVSLGQAIGPPIIRFLQDKFGFKGATMIFGAIMLHSCVGVCFFHPVQWHMKKPHQRNVEQTEEEVMITAGISDLAVSVNQSNPTTNTILTASVDSPESNVTQKQDGLHLSKNKTHQCELCVSESSQRIKNILNVQQGEKLRTEKTQKVDDTSILPSSVCLKLFRVVQTTSTNIRILHSPRACIIVVGCMLFNAGTYNFLMMVPFAVQADGHTLDDAALCLSVFSICNLSRILMCALSDCHWFRKRANYMAAFPVLSFCMLSKLVTNFFCCYKCKQDVQFQILPDAASLE